jgi:hypothetical protein
VLARLASTAGTRLLCARLIESFAGRTLERGMGALRPAACAAIGLFVAACAPALPPIDAGVTDGDAAADLDAYTDAAIVDAAVDAPTPDAGPVLRVLFVGNSYTRFNDLPRVVHDLAATVDGAPTLEVESVLVDGATLHDHWTTTGARERIHDGAFDVVVIQGQSTEPLRDDSDFGVYVDLLAEEAQAAGSRVVWFVTWARRAGHPDYERLGLGTPEWMTSALDRGYARWIGVRAHVGLAFQIAITELPDVELYDVDGSHPSAAGSLLAGCVLAEMVAGEPPHVPSPAPNDVPQGTAEALCAIAPRVGCLDGWTFCHGECVWVDSDPLHCSACDAACPGFEPCTGGVCGCPSPEQTACEGRFCTVLTDDDRNCGACGHACEAGSTCDDGACECLAAAALDVPIERLTALRPACVRTGDTWQQPCFEAAHAYCAALGCDDSGFGPIGPATFAPVPTITCVAGDVRTTTYDALRALVPECTGADVVTAPACVTAISRACIATGAVSGFGPVAGDTESLQITCLPAATMVRTTFATLAATWSACDGVVRAGQGCAYASERFCQSLGHASGFGPVETAGDEADVVCVDG